MTYAPGRATGPGSPPARAWDAVYAEACRRLASPRDARWIVEEASGLRWPFRPGGSTGAAPLRALARAESMVERRFAGEPLQYVLGSWPFRTLDLMVDRRVLIPRPETEQVAGVALRELDAISDGAAGGRLVAVDLGTGSGAIALSLAAERSSVEVWATDSSRQALDVACANLAGLGGSAATRVRLVPGDWWSALPSELRHAVDLVVSNPPYVSTAEMGVLPPEVRDWEPSGALHAGGRGTEAMEAILAEAPGWLTPRGVAVVEIGDTQAAEATAAALSAGFAEAAVELDLAGRPRILVARRAGPLRGCGR